MSLVINHNMMAMTAARNLGTVYNQLAVSTQRLSSGLRINSAMDDAAGLAVREFQRSEIAALNQGIRNAGDAISMIQTAEGALQVIDEKLIRMKELAQQAATGTYSSTQRSIMQDEYDAMADEITRIANATDFNGTKLLDGTMSATGTKIHFGTGNDSAEDYYYITISGVTAEMLGVNIGYASQGAVGTQAAVTSQAALTSEAAVSSQTAVASRAAASGASYASAASQAAVTSQASLASIASQAAVTSQAAVASQASTASHGIHGTIGSAASTAAIGSQGSVGSQASYASVATQAAVATQVSRASVASRASNATGASLTSQASIASQAAVTSQAAVASQAAQTSQASLAGYGVVLSAQHSAQNAIATINTAITAKDSARAGLGAVANRLENTITNLTIQAENTQAAESRVSDVDVAQEMTEFTKNQILVQAATAMLAQANTLPQLALQLIGGA